MSRRTVILGSAAALLLAYAPTLRILTGLWWSDEDLGHCFTVPFVAVWIAWRERERWQSVPLHGSWWGFAALLLGALMQSLALMGAGPFAGSVALLVSIAGVIWAMGGLALVRALAFPLALTIFMLPKLVILYNQLTLPMQLVATRFAAAMLSGAGQIVQTQGNVLTTNGYQVAVLEACNGMRYLLSLGFLSAVFGYVSGSSPWMRWTLLAAAIPVAILGNAIRVAAAGYSPAWNAGSNHAVAGWLIFVLCAALLVGVRRVLDSVRAHA